jgi:hypothetical protein
MEIFEQLHQQNFISQQELDKIKQQQPVSVHWDVRTLLYLGILLVTTALGILVYKNIDTIGHTAIITAIGVLCTACFVYCFKKANTYEHTKVESPNILFDYILLTACLLLLTFIGYLQYQYDAFGNRWGLAVFIPMVILFFCAYYFDHIGVLSIAITNLAAWLGITVTPLQILKQNNFSDTHLIYTGIVLGTALVIFSIVTQQKNIKKHFAFTYKNFGAHILFMALLAAMFNYHDLYLVWFLVIMAVAYWFFNNAVKENAFYFLVITVLYVYIAVCHVVIDLLFAMEDIGAIYLGAIYFIGSGIGLILLLMHYNKKLKHDAGI